jgi:hypothetical protein
MLHGHITTDAGHHQGLLPYFVRTNERRKCSDDYVNNKLFSEYGGI